MPESTPSSSCFHCGLPVLTGTDISVIYNGDNQPMCCYGCQAVSQAIIDSGMDDFYKYRTENPEKPEELVPEFLQQLKAYDNVEIQKRFVNETSDENILEVSLILEGITCAACVWLNEKHLNSLDGVISASINYSNHRARVRWDNNKIKLSDILASISRIGYLAHPYDPEQQQRILEKERKQHIKRLGLSGLLGMQIMIFAVAMYTGDWWGIDDAFKEMFRWISLVITIPILLFASTVFFKAAWRDLTHKRIGMDVPVSLGISIAFTASTVNTINGSGEVYFDSVAMFTFFLLSARFFEVGTRKQTAETTEALLNLKPTIATHLVDYSENLKNQAKQENVAVSELKTGDYILVRPGEVIAADGLIIEGSSGVNESLITGESLPVSKTINDRVIGGSTNTENPLIIQITELGENSVLSSIQRLIDEAQHTKPAIAKLADKIASWFVTIILSIAAIIAYYWYQTDPTQWIEITIATLVVSCPCALSLATPAAVTAASGQLARIGLLPKRSHALETLAQASDFVFDKTGTITEGKIGLINILTASDSELDSNDCLNIAASLEAISEHPIASAILQTNTQPLCTVENLKHTTGQGIKATINNQQWLIGNRHFIEDSNAIAIDTSKFINFDESGSHIFLAQKQTGSTTSKDQCVAIFNLSDSIREEAATLIEELHARNKNIHLLSGDNYPNTENISTQLGITHFKADQSPQDKLAEVAALQKQNAIVVMTGDGVNDAPVLAGANLSIAMGKGTQLAAATADMVLISNNIKHIFHGYLIATRTFQIIKQNLSWALMYNIVAIPATAMGYVEPWLAALGMSLSSLVVVINAMRLNRLKLDNKS